MFDGFDNRGFLNALASVKYYVTPAGEEKMAIPYGYYYVKEVENKYSDEEEDSDYLLYEADRALPIGYTYDQTMGLKEFETYSPMEKQEILMTNAVVDDTVDSGESISLTGYKEENVDIQMEGAEIKDNVLSFEKDAYITFSFTGQEDAETYFYFKGYAENDPLIDGYVRLGVYDGETYYSTDVWSRGNRYDTGQEYYMFNTGYHEDALHTVTVSFSTPGKLYLEDWGIYVQPMKNDDM